MSIHSRISELKRRIRKYKDYIGELEDLYRRTEEYYKGIESDIRISEECYDITKAGKWRGNLKDEGERLKDKIVSSIRDDQALTSDFMSDILVTIEKLYKLIKECEEEIEELEALLCAQTEPQM